jgi:hypothetical protein
MRIPYLIVATSVAAAFLACNQAFAAGSSGSERDFSLGGYASAGIHIHEDGKAEAAINEVSLFFTWDGNGRLRLFSEIEVEKPLTWQEGESLTTGDAYFDIERLYADYSLSGQMNFRAGRFLTPVGRWNLIHAAPLVWTSLRPAATRELFPLAINGLMLYGSIPWGEAAVEYSAFFEALRDETDDPGEIPYEKMRGVRLAYSGAFEAGVTLTQFREDAAGNPRYRMLELDFFKLFHGVEISGELFQRFEHGAGDNSGGAYVQAVAPLGNRWFAIGRLESLRMPHDDASGRWLLGAAWRVEDKRVFKLEYAGGHEDNPDMPRGFVASYAILF